MLTESDTEEAGPVCKKDGRQLYLDTVGRVIDTRTVAGRMCTWVNSTSMDHLLHVIGRRASP